MKALTRCLTLLLFLTVPPTPVVAQHFWEPTAGPTGGDILCLATAADGSVLAGLADGGVYRSTDAGRHWNPAGLTGVSVHQIVPMKSGLMLARTRYGFHRSSTDGATWSQGNGTVRFLSTLGVDSNNVLYAGADTTIYRSDDEGATWGPGVSFNDSWVRSITAATPSTVIATMSSPGEGMNLFRSSDGGNTWTPTTYLQITRLAANGTRLLGALNRDGALISLDTGASWTPLPSPFADPRSVNSIHQTLDGTMYVGSLDGWVARSVDTGKTWMRTRVTTTAVTTFLSIGGDLLCGTEGRGIFRSGDKGEHWTASSDGLRNTTVYSIIAHGNTIAVGLNGSVMSTSDRGETWRTLLDTIPPEMAGTANPAAYVTALATDLNGNYIAGTNHGSIYHVHADGSSPTIIRFAKGESIVGLVWLKSGTILATRGSGPVLRTTDRGATWTEDVFYDRVILLDSNGIVYLSGQSISIKRSIDEGATWEPIDIASFKVRIAASTIAPDGVFYIASKDPFAPYGTLRRSMDQAVTWDSVGEIPGSMLIVSTVAVNRQGTIFLAGGNQAIHSADGGRTWSDFSSGLADRLPQELTITEDGVLFLATDGNSVMRTSSSTVVSVDRERHGRLPVALTVETRMSGSYLAQFTTHCTGQYSLTIVNTHGETLRTLAEGTTSADEQSIEWNESDLPAGLYLLQLAACGQIVTCKLIIVH